MSDVQEAIRRRNNKEPMREQDREALRAYDRERNRGRTMTLRFPNLETKAKAQKAASKESPSMSEWILDAIEAKLQGRMMDKYRLESILAENARMKEDLAFQERSLREERTRNRELEGQMQDLVNRIVDMT